MKSNTKQRFTADSTAFILLVVLALIAAGSNFPALAQVRPGQSAESSDQSVFPKAEEHVDFVGRTEAVEIVQVTPRVSGHLTKISFRDGQQVQQGQSLFDVDPRWYQAELEKAEAELAGAKAETTIAQADLARKRALVANAAVTREEVEKAAAQVGAAEATMRAAVAAVTVARLNLEATRLTSPITGRASRAFLGVGNWIEPGKVLTTIVSQDPIYVYFAVDEKQYLRYSAKMRRDGGASKELRVPVQIGLANEQGFPHQGLLDFVDNQADPKTGTIRFRAVLKNVDGTLVPGLFARVRMAERQ